MSKVAVIGGGVIGLSSAWELHRRGAEVIVLDARAAGMAASSANAGWVSPSLSGPVPTPGLVKTSLKWMLNPESPLYIRPRLDPSFIKWLYKFWRACSASQYEAGLEATAILGQDTMRIMDDWVVSGVDFEMHEYGLRFVYRDPKEMEKDLAAFQTVTPFGYADPTPLYGDDLRHEEPVLTDAFHGGFLVKEERTVQPVSLVKGLIRKLEEVGVEIRSGTPVVDIDVSGKRVTSIRTPGDRIDVDHVLIAAGAWSRDIAKLAGAKVPIEAGKGYGLDFEPAPVRPKSSVYLHEDRIAVSPFENGLRLSGTMELSGLSDRYTPRRIEAIHKGGKRLLEGWPQDSEPTRVWTGMRPMAPDGLPVLGMIPGFQNLSVASGHAMLGVTLAAVTAVQMADLITTGKPDDLLKPFSVNRFRGIL